MLPAIGKRVLRRSGLAISELGFGGAPLGDLYAPLDDAEAVSTVTAAIDGGMTLIDTSPLYGHGLSEARVGTALRQRDRRDVVLCTKVGRWMTPATGPINRNGYAGGLPFSATLDYSRDGALRSLEQSLLRLGVSQVDIVLIHDLDRRNHGDALPARLEEAVNGAWPALRHLRDEGVVKAIGLGINEAEACLAFAERCDIDCVLLAGRYTLLDQSAASRFLPLALERNIDVMIAGVFNSGILASGPVAGARYDYAPAEASIFDRTRAIAVICTRHAVDLPTAAIHFARRHPAVTSVVLGAVSPAEVQRNRASWFKPPPDALWEELEASGLIPRLEAMR
jgi:D-threo-aldose 1-dehydrogenase